MRLEKLIKDPLLQFLAIGAALFVILGAIKPAENDDRILVNREALLTYIQYRSKAFDDAAAGSILDAMSADERKQLVNEYVREEALYREAARMGAAEGDYVIRQRMVQKLEFMAQASAPPPVADRTTLEAFYAAHLETYFRPPEITFSHIFISTSERTADEARAIAEDVSRRLKSSDAGFSDASGYGDRFIYNINYVERSFEYVESHFGSSMTKSVFKETTPLNEWIGPISSDHGLHLVYIAERKPGETPSFDDVSDRVASDFARDWENTEADKIVAAIVESYRPEIKLEDVTDTPAVTGEQQ